MTTRRVLFCLLLIVSWVALATPRPEAQRSGGPYRDPPSEWKKKNV